MAEAQNRNQSQPLVFVRTGLLHVPRLDAVAGEAVARKLIGALRRVVIQQESYAASDRRWVEDTLCKWCDEDELDLLLTIGGTLPAPGPGGLEIVPEATSAVVERLVPGLGEAMRAYVREEFPGVALHRGIAGIRGRTLIVNLPAGSDAAALFLEAILEDLPYILAHLRGDAAAVTLAEIVREGEDAAGTEESVPPIEPEKPAEVKPQKPAGRGLNADEFAAFLRRGKQGDV
jgi:molybdopterin biosynthesis enzyme MoaB